MTTVPLGLTDKSGELRAVHDIYRKWFGADYDIGALNVVLCAAVSAHLSGDPPWVLVVGGSGNCKTETIVPLEAAGARVISTLTGEAALLSGTPAKSRAKDATGGLLREIGSAGTLVIKDVTSILSMNRDTRGQVLGALREIYDGHWSRNAGTDGGFSLTWRGRLIVIGAVTTAWDRAHEVVSVMGDRFLLVRLHSDDMRLRLAAGMQAMGNVSRERQMRDELSAAVGKLLALTVPEPAPRLAEASLTVLVGMADLVTRARTPVERDYQGNPAWAHALEMPTRFAKQLVQLVRGGLVLGLEIGDAMEVAARACHDSMPPVRRLILGDILENPDSTTADVIKRVQLPRQTADRALQELHLLGMLVVNEIPWGMSVRWIYRLTPGTDTDALARFTRNVSSAP